MTHQTEIINLEDLVPADHTYRKFNEIVDIEAIATKHLKTAQGKSNYKGYGIVVLFKALLLQHLEDISDRELERYLAENTAGKWSHEFARFFLLPVY